MSGIFTKMRSLPAHYPLIRGMISYSIIWPTCSIVQEYLEHGVTLEQANFARAARFGIFGSLFMAPVFYGWMKFSGRFFKTNTLKTAIVRAAIEQVTYSPLAMVYFFFGMSLLEFKPLHVCWNEVKEKFWPTYKMGVIFWPTAQTFNFYCVSEKNRVVFVSLASFIWTLYLAHMKAKEQKNVMFNRDINVLNLTESLPNYKVVVQSDTLVDNKDQPLEGASTKPNDSNKPNLKKNPEAGIGVAPKDQVVSESDGDRILQKDRTHSMATAPIVTPAVPDKIIPATPIVNTDKTSPVAKVSGEPVNNADKMPHNTIIIEPGMALPTVTANISLDTPDKSTPEKDSESILDKHMLTVENTNQSSSIAKDLYEQSIDTGLSEYKGDNSYMLPDIGLETNLVTPKIDAVSIILAKQSGPEDDDKFSGEDGSTSNAAAIESCPKDGSTILKDNT